jgi:hypothetical protein
MSALYIIRRTSHSFADIWRKSHQGKYSYPKIALSGETRLGVCPIGTKGKLINAVSGSPASLKYWRMKMKTTVTLRDDTLGKLRVYMAAKNISFKQQSEVINDLVLKDIPSRESILNSIGI